MLIFPLYFKNTICGQLTLVQTGTKTQASVRMYNNGLGVYKIYAQNSHTLSRLSLGIVIPDDDMLTLSKTLTCAQMQANNLSAQTIDSAVAELVCLASGQPLDKTKLDISALFKDKLFAKIPPLERAFLREHNGCKAVFVPHAGEFVFSFVFCLCKILVVNGEEYIVLGINHQGMPCISHMNCDIIDDINIVP